MDLDLRNFSGGLDARKFKLSNPEGTLTALLNAHVNQGGELEKRKAFLDIPLPSQTFGSQETQDTVVVFGSRDLNALSASVIFSDGTGAVLITGSGWSTATLALPVAGDPVTVAASGITGVNGTWQLTAATDLGGGNYSIEFFAPGAANNTTFGVGTVTPRVDSPAVYQRLLHPLGTTISMTAVTASAYFDGETFAVTTWTNGDVLVFAGSTMVTDFYVGKKSNIENSLQAMAADIVAQVNASGLYTATLDALTGYLYLTVTGGTAGAGNQLTYLGYNFNRPVSLVETSGNPGSIDTSTEFFLLAAPVAWVTDNATTAQAIVDAINTDGDSGGANKWGFVATRSGSDVRITPPATDASGATLGRDARDTLDPTVGGNVTVFKPSPSAGFDVLSIPSDFNVPQFTVDYNADDLTVQYKLVNNGVQPTAPTGAVGQISVAAALPNPPAKATITAVTNPADGTTLTIGSTIYTFKTTITGVANQVKIATTAALTLANLVSAVNITSGAGTAYSAATLINANASASAVAGGITTLTASLGGTGGNSLALAQSAAHFTLGAFAGGGSYAEANIDSTGVNVSNNDTVTINGKVYTFQTVLTNVDGHVFIGADANTSLLNLLMAINLTGTAGTTYATATTLHPTVRAVNLDTTSNILSFRAKSSGSGGNALTLAKSAVTLTVSGATFAGGGADANKISSVTVAGVDLLNGTAVGVTKDVSTLINDLVTLINANSGVTNFSASAANNIISLIANDPGTTYNAAEVIVTAAGSVCVANCYIQLGATAGQNVSIIAGNLAANMLTNTITFQSTGYTTENSTGFALRLAENINANAANFYRAVPVGNQLFLSARIVSSSDAAENIVTTATATTVGGQTTTMTVTLLSPQYLSWVSYSIYYKTGSQTRYKSAGNPNSAVLQVTGGAAPYIYKWRRVSSGTTGGSTPQISDSTNTPGVTKNNYQWWDSGRNSLEEWKCDIYDIVGNTVTTPSIWIQ